MSRDGGGVSKVGLVDFRYDIFPDAFTVYYHNHITASDMSEIKGKISDCSGRTENFIS